MSDSVDALVCWPWWISWNLKKGVFSAKQANEKKTGTATQAKRKRGYNHEGSMAIDIFFGDNYMLLPKFSDIPWLCTQKYQISWLFMPGTGCTEIPPSVGTLQVMSHTDWFKLISWQRASQRPLWSMGCSRWLTWHWQGVQHICSGQSHLNQFDRSKWMPPCKFSHVAHYQWYSSIR